MQAIIETPTYLRDARQAGLGEEALVGIANVIAANPTAGELMPGTGGARKVRVAGRGKGKSGGYRIVSYFAAEDVPVFLLAIIDKGERANLSKVEQNDLRKELRSLTEDYRAGVKMKIRENQEREMSRLGKRLIRSAKEARTIVRGEADPATYRVRVPAKIDVKAIRKARNMSQEEFSARFGIPIGTLRDWEQDRRQPEGPARVLLTVIEREPKAVERALALT